MRPLSSPRSTAVAVSVPAAFASRRPQASVQWASPSALAAATTSTARVRSSMPALLPLTSVNRCS
ncbi:hypothetical protein BJF78_36790 [Pseudonocardia sp. CNS-139]|nr:hypothetical protein BJF78_36790 [Pseudonocardia sp. CNS-139]